MSAYELVSLMMGGGVLAQGVAALRWAVRVEMRLTALEKKGANNVEAHATA